ncbi:nose resistant to fluoxetine protein 6-like [Coccinella septempunctata]|uniref:nose resistant to fluoxetine protein 6-like n=1 Tax=Coccinella septempunctata TaxID=41139 RepID=UPI001D063CF7|nr:nose resistant to fluoxetine protein 6-like [Coccinella septempunctata]
MNVFNLCIVIFSTFLALSYGDHCLQRAESVKLSEICSKQLKNLCKNHDLLFSFWDSSSRQIHSGLSATNNEDLGNYDQCISIDEKLGDTNILGKFCPLQWATALPKNILTELVVALEEYNPINILRHNETSRLGSSTEKVDVFKQVVNLQANAEKDNIILIGSICIPDGCTPEEFTEVFNPYIYPVDYTVQNSSTNCFTKEDISHMSTFQIIVTICICVIVSIVIVSTAYHAWLYNKNKEEPPEIIKAFSVLNNGKKLFKISWGNKEQIQCIHGLRFLSMVWVIAGHTFAGADSIPHFNHKDVEKWKSQLYSEYIQAGHYAVDTFFFLSGFLLAYGYMKQMKDVQVSKQIKSIPLMILHRYLRLTPAVAALFFVSLSFLESLGNGPLWIYSLEVINEPCRKNWWKYFLYIQNYGSDKMCYLHTWYLSADMQMFLVAPIVLIPASVYFRRNLRIVISALAGLTIFCVGLTIGIRYIVDDYSNEYDTHSRLSDYLVGIIGGILIHTQRGKHIKINKILNLVLWIVSLALMIFLVLYLNDVVENPTKDKTNFFYAIQRPIWSACILWIIFSCHHGYGGIINRFLCISCFQIGSRLSYCMYIVHLSLIIYNIGAVRTYQFVNDYNVLYTVCGNVVASLIISLLWTLTFEAPMIILNKMLLGKFESPKK